MSDLLKKIPRLVSNDSVCLDVMTKLLDKGLVYCTEECFYEYYRSHCVKNNLPCETVVNLSRTNSIQNLGNVLNLAFEPMCTRLCWVSHGYAELSRYVSVDSWLDEIRSKVRFTETQCFYQDTRIHLGKDEFELLKQILNVNWRFNQDFLNYVKLMLHVLDLLEIVFEYQKIYFRSLFVQKDVFVGYDESNKRKVFPNEIVFQQKHLFQKHEKDMFSLNPVAQCKSVTSGNYVFLNNNINYNIKNNINNKIINNVNKIQNLLLLSSKPLRGIDIGSCIGWSCVHARVRNAHAYARPETKLPMKIKQESPLTHHALKRFSLKDKSTIRNLKIFSLRSEKPVQDWNSQDFFGFYLDEYFDCFKKEDFEFKGYTQARLIVRFTYVKKFLVKMLEGDCELFKKYIEWVFKRCRDQTYWRRDNISLNVVCSASLFKEYVFSSNNPTSKTRAQLESEYGSVEHWAEPELTLREKTLKYFTSVRMKKLEKQGITNIDYIKKYYTEDSKLFEANVPSDMKKDDVPSIIKRLFKIAEKK